LKISDFVPILKSSKFSNFQIGLMNVLELFKNITTFVFDVDGVLTDGSILVLPDGVQARRMNIKDGYALQLAVKKGYRVVVISGGNSPEVMDRLNKLGVTDVFMKVSNKLEVMEEFMLQHQILPQHVLFMGDDIPDLDVMKHAGLAACPADAVNEIKEIAHYISHLKGGEGCGRDVIEKTMKLRSHWNEDVTVRSQ
jgi:3-deoxy-D-manno-octulosonate 8-phosphate phosphatase (KDO 8-P phosphatase)